MTHNWSLSYVNSIDLNIVKMHCTYKVTRKVKFPIPEGNMPTIDASLNSLLHGPL